MKQFDYAVDIIFAIDLVLSFFKAYINEKTHQEIISFDLTYKNYLYGWFIVDLVAVFPFYLVLSGGIMLKLLRFARMPRLLKLMDPNRFETLIRSLEKESDI